MINSLNSVELCLQVCLHGGWRGCAVPGCGVHLYCFIDSLVYCFSNYQLARNSPIEPRDEMECYKKHGAVALYLS